MDLEAAQKLFKQQLAQQNIEEARQSVKRVHQKVLDEAGENKLVLERLYNSITVVAGGTLALSITYLGYLKSSTPSHLWMMKTSWASLLICLTASIFYQDFHSRYVHHARLREYAQKLVAHRKVCLAEKDVINVVDENGVPWTGPDLALSLTNEITKFESDVKWNKKREDCYSKFDVWSARVARVTLVSGLFFLLLFAVENS